MDKRVDNRITRTSGMNTWRAGCSGSCTSGSEGGPQKPTRRKPDRALRSDPYTSETDPYSAGLGFAVRASKPDFLGKAALGPRDGGDRRLVCLVLDDPRSVALGNEPVKTPDGDVIGRVSSGGLGYTIGASIAYAWVPAVHAAPGTPLTVEVFGVTVPAEVRADPLFDPKGERIRA